MSCDVVAGSRGLWRAMDGTINESIAGRWGEDGACGLWHLEK